MTKQLKTLTEAQAALLRYAAAGFRVFPVSGKIPVVKAWQKSEYAQQPNLSRFPNNFGIALDSTHLVIDIDPRNFALNDPNNPELGRVNSFDRLCKDLGVDLTLQCGFVVETGSGGRHLYFYKKHDFLTKGGLRQYPGVEFKTAGQYVVGYGSIHPETKNTYKLIQGGPETLTEVSNILLAAIERKPYDFVTGNPMAEFQDDDLTKKRYQEYLLTAPEAIEGHGGDKQTYQVACHGRDLGLHPHTAYDLMCKFYNPRCEPPWDLDEIMVKIKNAYRYAQNDKGILHPKADFIPLVIKKEDVYPHTNKVTGDLIKDLHNTCNIIVTEGSRLTGLFGFNQMTHRIEFVRLAPWHKEQQKIGEITDYDIIQMKAWISRFGPYEPSTILLREAVMAIAKIQEFNPVKDYLKGLKWDGKPRLSSWLIDYAGADDNQYVKAVCQKLLVAMIARVFQPGVKFDTMCILEGPQGLKKSMMWEILAGEYYTAKSLDTQDKDFLVSAMTSWIVEIADMATNRHSDTEHIKAFLSTRIDKIRLPYAHYSQEIPRQFIITGTKNLDEDKINGYLSDITGNRRFWIVPVRGVETKDGARAIDTEGFKEVRDQLFAEAMLLYNQNYKIYFDDRKVIELSEQIQNSRMGRDPWSDRVIEWVMRNDIIRRPVLTTMDVYTECLGGQAHKCGIVDQKRISSILKSMAFQHGTFWHPGLKNTVRGYRPPTPSEVEQYAKRYTFVEEITIGDL